MNWFIYALIAALLLSVTMILEKQVLKKEHALEFVTSLSLLNFVFSIPLFLAVDYKTLQVEPLLIIGVSAFISTVSVVLSMRSLRHMEVSAVSPLYITTPAVTVVLAAIFLGEYLSFYQVLGIGILVIGTYLLEAKRKSSNSSSSLRTLLASRYTHYIFISILLFSVNSLIARFILTHYSIQPAALLAVAHLYISIIFFIYFIMRYDGIKGIKRSFKRYGWSLALISFLSILYRYSEVKSMQLASVGLVIAVVKSSNLLTIIIGGKLFKEHDLPVKIWACLIMIIGMILIFK